jgi:peptide deformylase
VLTIDDKADSVILRKPCSTLSDKALLSSTYRKLEELMLATVKHPTQDGVGIAAPQVGISRRVVAVQRFDKEGHPFEVYPNIRIVWKSDSLAVGPEGCLSVPSRSEQVRRSSEIVIEYTDISATGKPRNHASPVIRDTVRGFTAVIFQHETDHLDGILYIDRL